ncbi:MAG: hypothetical protein AB1938_26940 [Myxococcota bacterium]
MRWFVFGAQALAALGLPRATQDVDVTVDPGGRSTAEVVDLLADAGLALRDSFLDEDFVARTRVLPLVHRSSGTPVDVVLAGPGLEDLQLSRAEVRKLGGVQVPVIAVNDLVAVKVLAGRPKDLDDVARILRAAPPELDVLRVRELLAEIGALVDDSTLLETFERLGQRR